MYTDHELADVLVDIDRALDSTNAWLTPRSRFSLLAAREVIETVLERRRQPWTSVRPQMA
jgi:hypothetical protein